MRSTAVLVSRFHDEYFNDFSIRWRFFVRWNKSLTFITNANSKWCGFDLFDWRNLNAFGGLGHLCKNTVTFDFKIGITWFWFADKCSFEWLGSKRQGVLVNRSNSPNDHMCMKTTILGEILAQHNPTVNYRRLMVIYGQKLNVKGIWLEGCWVSSWMAFKWINVKYEEDFWWEIRRSNLATSTQRCATRFKTKKLTISSTASYSISCRNHMPATH